jgi:hypothetical protein
MNVLGLTNNITKREEQITDTRTLCLKILGSCVRESLWLLPKGDDLTSDITKTRSQDWVAIRCRNLRRAEFSPGHAFRRPDHSVAQRLDDSCLPMLLRWGCQSEMVFVGSETSEFMHCQCVPTSAGLVAQEAVFTAKLCLSWDESFSCQSSWPLRASGFSYL